MSFQNSKSALYSFLSCMDQCFFAMYFVVQHVHNGPQTEQAGCRWVIEQNKDGKAKCGCTVLEGRSTWTGKWSGVWLGTCFSGMLNCSVKKLFKCAMSIRQRFLHMLHINLKDRCRLFSLRHFSYCVDSKRLNGCSILTRRINITHFCTNYRPTLLLFFSLCDTFSYCVDSKM